MRSPLQCIRNVLEHVPGERELSELVLAELKAQGWHLVSTPELSSIDQPPRESRMWNTTELRLHCLFDERIVEVVESLPKSQLEYAVDAKGLMEYKKRHLGRRFLEGLGELLGVVS